jgi:hypothetical protein
LRRLIEDGTVTAVNDPKDVYNMCDEFKNYKEENFTTNLQNLLKAVTDDLEATQLDELALVNDRMIQGPQPENTPFGYPQWYGTEVQ